MSAPFVPDAPEMPPEVAPGTGARLLRAVLSLRAYGRHHVRPALAAARAAAGDLEEAVLVRIARIREPLSILAILACYAAGSLSPDRMPELAPRVALLLPRSYRFMCENALGRCVEAGLPDHDGLNRSSIMATYHALATYVNQDGFCWPSYDALAIRSGLERHVVIRCVRWLEEHNWIIVHRRDRADARRPDGSRRTTQKNRSNFYTVLPAPLEQLAELDMEGLVELLRNVRADEATSADVQQLLDEADEAAQSAEPQERDAAPPRRETAEAEPQGTAAATPQTAAAAMTPAPAPARSAPAVTEAQIRAVVAPELAGPIAAIDEITGITLDAEGVIGLGRVYQLDRARVAKVLKDVQREVLARSAAGWRWDRKSLGHIVGLFIETEAAGGRRGASTLQGASPQSIGEWRPRGESTLGGPEGFNEAVKTDASERAIPSGRFFHKAPDAQPDPERARKVAQFEALSLKLICETNVDRKAQIQAQLDALMDERVRPPERPPERAPPSSAA